MEFHKDQDMTAITEVEDEVMISEVPIVETQDNSTNMCQSHIQMVDDILDN